MSGDHDAHAATARRWWLRLKPDPARGRPGDPATLARLRRAGSTTQALAEAETLRLWATLDLERDRLARVATIARVLAHIRAAEPPVRLRGALVRSLGPRPDGEVKLKRLRFERLLATREEEDLARAMTRLVQLAGRDTPIDPGDLAAAILAWDEERTRIDWAIAYHDPRGDAPDTDQAS
jgi:CRISPR type I-E-associated protein CasB/Cse2